MDTIGWVILVVVGLAFLGLGVWAFTRGREYQYPPGYWVERTLYGVRLRVIYHPELEGVPGLELAENLAWYVRAAAQAWGARHPGDAAMATRTVEHTVVCIKPASMADVCMCGGVQGWVFRAIGGSDIPLVTLPESSMDTRLPAFVVHEALHAIRSKCKGGADPLHQDLEIWGAVEDAGKAIARGPRFAALTSPRSGG